jgi:hypothetical protein
LADDIPMDMPAPVEPAPGAEVVEFPWDAAASAVGALHEAAATLRGQLDSRAALLPTIVDWEGSYRDDFDAAYTRLTATASGLAETLASRAGSVISAAETAAAQQMANNTAAEEAAAAEATATTTGGAGDDPSRRSPGRSAVG